INLEVIGYACTEKIRRKAYFDLLACAHGHTYGCNNIWQMYAPGRIAHINPTKPWYESLDLPGARSMSYVKKLMTSRPLLERIPDQSMVTESGSHYKKRVQATRGEGYAFIYASSGQHFEVIMGKISGRKIRASWYNPRNGETAYIGTFKNKGRRTFAPPVKREGEDWVLILDDARKEYREL